MNGFERHKQAFTSKTNPDIHLSASTFNLMVEAIDVFVAEKIFGMRGSFGAAPMRGIVVEDAVKDILLGGSEEASIKKALDKFDKRMMIGDSKTEKERNMIEPCVKLAVEALKPYGQPEFDNGRQKSIRLDCKTEDFTIPFVGYLDFVFPEQGAVIDLKTTGRMPSVMSTSHQIQRVLYQKANGNQNCSFLYVTPKKAEFRSDGDVNETLNYIKTQVIRLEAFLNSGDKEHLRKIVPVNPNSFYWGGNEAARKELYGI